jgi:hypothetical protein
VAASSLLPLTAFLNTSRGLAIKVAMLDMQLLVHTAQSPITFQTSVDPMLASNSENGEVAEAV